ncbi:hypothetical protein PV327_006150 [Microctonus hyperodae]|uniref:Uncharacterized protein n=1 Tax=Microctonus hyperodae TaxID=165561 RepID=A0AA39G365_MICHY|nr:hypothetical protein PV327_006150 [Microctonus hyperodae]
MAEIDAKVNMSLDEIIKMTRQEKKKKPIVPVGKGGPKKNNKRNIGNGRSYSGLKVQDSNFRKNTRPTVTNGLKKRSQAWRLQRRQTNVGFIGKRYKQPNGNIRSLSSTNLNKVPKLQQSQQNNKKISGFTTRIIKNGKIGLMQSRSRSNNNATATIVKNFFTNNSNNNKGLKKTNSLPDLRNPNSVHSRLGYQSPAQIAYRNRVKRAKQLLLQRQTQKQLSNDHMIRRQGKFVTALQQRALDCRQQISTPQKLFSTGGLRSDQILRSQRRAQYAQKFMRINAARINPNPTTNFMCTLGKSYDPIYQPRGINVTPRQSRPINNNNFQHHSRERSSLRQISVSLHLPPRSNANTSSRTPLSSRARSRSRSRSRTHPTLIQTGGNADDRSFSEVMYSVSNNLGVTGRTLNDRFSF